MTQRKPLVTSIHLEEVIHKSSGVSESLSWSAFSSNMTKEIWQNMEWYYMLIGWWQSHSKAQSSFFFYWLSQQTARHGLPGRSHHSMSQESVTFTKTINRATTEMATQKTSLWSVSLKKATCWAVVPSPPCPPLLCCVQMSSQDFLLYFYNNPLHIRWYFIVMENNQNRVDNETSRY